MKLLPEQFGKTTNLLLCQKNIQESVLTLEKNQQPHQTHRIKELGHEKIDILKMDIEGAEFEVIHDIICDGIEFGQLCIEVHDRFFENGDKRLKDSIP